MTRKIAIVVVALLAVTISPGWGQELTVVSPAGLENIEGNSFSDDPDPTGRAQYLILSSDVAALPVSHRTIIGFAGRLDVDAVQPPGVDFVEVTVPDLQVRLSTSNLAGLSSNFDDNVGDDETLVFEGDAVQMYPYSGSPGGPRDFATPLLFDPPFHYDPSEGNLILDFVVPSPQSPVIRVDWHNMSRPRALVSSSTVGTGTLLNGMFPIQLIFVPEPASFVLILAGLLGLGMRRR